MSGGGGGSVGTCPAGVGVAGDGSPLASWPGCEDVPGSTALNNLNRDGAQEGRGPGAANP